MAVTDIFKYSTCRFDEQTMKPGMHWDEELGGKTCRSYGLIEKRAGPGLEFRNMKKWTARYQLFQLPASVKLEYMGQHKKFFKINYTFYYWKQMYFEQTVLFWINKYDNLSNCKQLTGPVFRGKNLSNSILAEFGINKQLLYNILDQFSDQ